MTEEQNVSICFMGSKDEKTANIHWKIKKQYSTSENQIYLMQIALVVITLLANMLDIIADIEWFTKENQQVTNKDMAGELSISHGSAYDIIHNLLQYQKSPISRVPKQFTPDDDFLFWNCGGSILEHYVHRITTNNREPYCDLLENYLKL